MAFSVARRAAAVPLLVVNGTYRTTIRSYLDSSILQHQLQRLNEQGALKGTSYYLIFLNFFYVIGRNIDVNWIWFVCEIRYK